MPALGENNTDWDKGEGEHDEGQTMRLLLRMTFWLGVVLVLLPTLSSRETAPAQSARVEISASEAVSAATATVADVGRFCDRQPSACAVGAQVAAAIGTKAQAGAKILYDFINERRQTTGSVASGERKPSVDTLTASDLAPAWRGPPKHTATQAKPPV